MWYVSIDPSLISTAVVVGNGESFTMLNFCREKDSRTKKGWSKWFSLCEELVQFILIDYNQAKGYSEGEMSKLQDYNSVTEQIVDQIVKLTHGEKFKVAIEGFSFSSSAGDIIDLVTFSTLLRIKLLSLTKDITIVSPMTLKQLSCKLTYEPIDIGKKKPKLVWKNKSGIAGGHFTKREVFLSIIESDRNDKWTLHCKSMASEILAMRSIPKPYEDCCDAFILYQSQFLLKDLS